MNKKNIFIWFGLLFLIACTNVQVVKIGNFTDRTFPPIHPSDIVILRSTVPTWDFAEIGIITVRDIDQIDVVYDQMRTEAAKYGADGIIEFEIESVPKTVRVTENVAKVRTGSRSNVAEQKRKEEEKRTRLETRYFHVASGTMIIKSERVK